MCVWYRHQFSCSPKTATPCLSYHWDSIVQDGGQHTTVGCEIRCPDSHEGHCSTVESPFAQHFFGGTSSDMPPRPLGKPLQVVLSSTWKNGNLLNPMDLLVFFDDLATFHDQTNMPDAYLRKIEIKPTSIHSRLNLRCLVPWSNRLSCWRAPVLVELWSRKLLPNFPTALETYSWRPKSGHQRWPLSLSKCFTHLPVAKHNPWVSAQKCLEYISQCDPPTDPSKMGPLVALGWRWCSNQRATIPTEGIIRADPQPQSEGGGQRWKRKWNSLPFNFQRNQCPYIISTYIPVCMYIYTYRYLIFATAGYCWISWDNDNPRCGSQVHRDPDNGTGPECGVRGSEKFQSSSEMVYHFIDAKKTIIFGPMKKEDDFTILGIICITV